MLFLFCVVYFDPFLENTKQRAKRSTSVDTRSSTDTEPLKIQTEVVEEQTKSTQIISDIVPSESMKKFILSHLEEYI